MALIESEHAPLIPVAGEGRIIPGEFGAPECLTFLSRREVGEADAIRLFNHAMRSATGMSDGQSPVRQMSHYRRRVNGRADILPPQDFPRSLVDAVDVGPHLFLLHALRHRSAPL